MEMRSHFMFPGLHHLVIFFQQNTGLVFYTTLMGRVGFPGGSEVKNPPANAGDAGLIPELGRSPGGGNGNPFQFLCGEFHEQRSLVGYSP